MRAGRLRRQAGMRREQVEDCMIPACDGAQQGTYKSGSVQQ
jgi:hypothetical protein